MVDSSRLDSQRCILFQQILGETFSCWQIAIVELPTDHSVGLMN